MTETVQRFRHGCGGYDKRMLPEPTGDWVRYSDYEQLQARINVATPPDTPVVAREAARNAAREWLRGERAAMYSTALGAAPPQTLPPQMQKQEDDAVERLAAIITRNLAGTPEHDADVWDILTEVAATTCWDKNSGKIGGPTECDWCQRCRAKRLLEQRTPRFIGSPNALRRAAMDIATKLAGEYIDPEIALGTIPDIESVLANYAATPSPETPEPLEFRTTKEAMEYAQRNNIPAVVPVVADGDDEGEHG